MFEVDARAKRELFAVRGKKKPVAGANYSIAHVSARPARRKGQQSPRENQSKRSGGGRCLLRQNRDTRVIGGKRARAGG